MSITESICWCPSISKNKPAMWLTHSKYTSEPSINTELSSYFLFDTSLLWLFIPHLEWYHLPVSLHKTRSWKKPWYLHIPRLSIHNFFSLSGTVQCSLNTLKTSQTCSKVFQTTEPDNNFQLLPKTHLQKSEISLIAARIYQCNMHFKGFVKIFWKATLKPHIVFVHFLGRANYNALIFPHKIFAEPILRRRNFSATEC